MTLTLDLSPELQAQLREEATKVGMEEGEFVLNTLQERLHAAPISDRKLPPRLSREETALLLEINQGLPEKTSQEYHDLVAKRRAETLTPEEHARLMELTDIREIANARRLENLITLARLRNTTLDALMDQLGIRPPGYL